MNEQIIQNLLTQVSAINKKYEKIAEITGENFNIFRILKVEANEVKTHSAFLCELLNPKGSHGFKDAFLKFFLQQQRVKYEEYNRFLERFVGFNTTSSTVSVENHIGFINEDDTEGGRIDILIKDTSKHAIILENKIYAVDQPKQLVRYNNSFKEAPIFYLTLYGSPPSEKSKGELIEGDHFIRISYEVDILQWLEQCRKEAVNQPILRETFTQYINLIKYLTHQTMNDNLKAEVINQIIANPENIDSAEKIASVWLDVQYEIVRRLIEKAREIANKLNIKFLVDGNIGEKESGFLFYREGWKHCIFYCFDSVLNSILVGVDHVSNEEKCDEEKYRNGLKDFVIGEKMEKSGWMWVTRFKPWSDTSRSNILKKIPIEIENWTLKILDELDKLEKANK